MSTSIENMDIRNIFTFNIGKLNENKIIINYNNDILDPDMDNDIRIINPQDFFKIFKTDT